MKDNETGEENAKSFINSIIKEIIHGLG